MTEERPLDRFNVGSSESLSIYSLAPTHGQRASPGLPEIVDDVDSINPTPPLRSNVPPNPFNTSPSLGTSSNSSAVQLHQQRQSQKYFRSRRIKKGEAPQSWKTKKDPREKWVTIIPLIGLALGFALAGFLVYDGLQSVVHHNYKLVLDEDWSGGFNTDVWLKEAQVGGYGNGLFDQTTDTDENVYVHDGKLYIKPTLQNETLITTNNNLSLGASCTGRTFYDCNAVTNTTNGTIVPPVKSGRITTMKGPTIKYGRVEVTATLPSGDWLWPAIWLLPVNATYGPWPASGEIDIAESRGNNYTYPQGGNDIVSSALHWGPDPKDDAFWRTNNKLSALHTTFAAKEHTFGVEWSQKYIFTYVDTRLMQVLYNPFTPEGLWARGQFPLSLSNGTTITDPWVDGGFNAPFDQEFYLILNVAVGATNGWFQDGAGGKPWVDNSLTAKKDFWDARDQWLPTWGAGAQMVVSKVQMWQQLD